jgi:replicative DNA helicase
MKTAPIFIDDSAGLTPTEVRARARRLQRENKGKLGLIVIDYLQLMQVAGTKENRATEISEISRSLKALAKELHAPVVALSQLNRSVEQRTDKKPVMSDLRECVTGDTLVVLTDGRRAPIRTLVGQRPRVLSVDARQKIVAADAEVVWSVGRKPVFDLMTASGRVLRATAEHRVLSGEGWRALSELGTESAVAVVQAPPDDSSLRWAESDLFWDRVVGIEPRGEEEVFDLTVPGPASWLADGLVSHNSGAIEQDADLIVMIYREEVYEPDTPRKGIADIIVTKQRNGPTGEVHLTFLGKYTRFENLATGDYDYGG